MLDANSMQWYNKQNNKSDLYTVRLSTGLNVVDVWSTQRLQFEPKGWQKDLQKDIRNAVQQLKGSKDRVLHALYGTHITEFCDVENILFYNIGASSFTHLAQHGIRFERSFIYPDPPHTLMGQLHYHRYAVVDAKAGFLKWKAGRTLARWSNIGISRVNSGTKCTFVWYRFRSKPAEILYRPTTLPNQYGLSIEIMVPFNETVNIAGFMKPLLDGLIASFHVHNGKDSELVSQRLSQDLGLDSHTVAELLHCPDRAILGMRKLLWPYRSSVQWNPGDDLCFAAELHVKPYGGGQWAISGSLFEIEAV